ncbi:MAG: glucuronate isomerase [Candidatus Hydrogenedentes bacterium]|nr:glucuronate isomerase [Candidatus Hydrogenedentota bacterium]
MIISYSRGQEADVRQTVGRIVRDTPVTDLHTHLYAPPFGPLLLYGVDELLTYHYLIAEVVRATRVPYESYWSMSKRDQAAFIWRSLFVERSPIGEACRGVLTALDRLGLDVSSRDLDAYRAFFEDVSIDAHIDRVFAAARVRDVVMTNDPFDPIERPTWDQGFAGDKRFHAALRIDPLLNDYTAASEKLRGWGYNAGQTADAPSLAEVRRFLSDHVKRMKALYMAVSLPPDFAYPDNSLRSKLISECVVPVAAEYNIPFALMIGVKRAVNPSLKLAGDGVARADVGAVERLCARFPKNKFMVTMLSRENQHDLCVAGRKLPNLFIFGCWWFLNNPSLIEEMTRMRIELLGLSVTPQHSDARVLEQVIYKWEHSRAIIGKVLEDKYCDLLAAGWTVAEDEIRRDVTELLGGGFWGFLRAEL